jgi:hypothetical protein
MVTSQTEYAPGGGGVFSERAEQRRGLIPANAGGGDIGVDVGLQQVMGWHLVLLAAFLVQSDPPALALGIVVLDIHVKRGGNAGEGVDQQRNQRAVAQADNGARVDGTPSSWNSMPLPAMVSTPYQSVAMSVPTVHGQGFGGRGQLNRHISILYALLDASDKSLNRCALLVPVQFGPCHVTQAVPVRRQSRP